MRKMNERHEENNNIMGSAVSTEPVDKKKAFEKKEKLLVPVAIFLGILLDRAVSVDFIKGLSVYYIVYLAVFYYCNWRKLKTNPVTWGLAAFSLLLCSWYFIFDYTQTNDQYSALNFIVIPLVLMTHAQYSVGFFSLKDVWGLANECLMGFLIKPFTAIYKFIGIINSLLGGENHSTFKKIFAGLLISVPILLVILPLLSTADMVFGYYLNNIFKSFDMGNLIFHILVISIASLMLFSSLWNVCFGIVIPVNTIKKINLDTLICSVVLSVILVCYLLFCFVQFTYLFAGAGLPNDLTYSEYARQGFWQLIVVSGINLILFGVILQYSARTKILGLMLFSLLACTLFMQVSAFIRLKLYIGTFGMTWLRLISMWFIIYLLVVIILCALRMFKDKIPLIALASFVLLFWFTALGYINPDGFIENYNRTHNKGVNVDAPVETNRLQ